MRITSKRHTVPYSIFALEDARTPLLKLAKHYQESLQWTQEEIERLMRSNQKSRAVTRRLTKLTADRMFFTDQAGRLVMGLDGLGAACSDVKS